MYQTQINAMRRAVDVLGSQAKLARALGVTPVTVGQWLKPEDPTGRQVPPKQCVRIEQLTGGAVERRDLRSVDYLEIWPELAQAQANPAPAATELIAAAQAGIAAVVQEAKEQLHQLEVHAEVEIKHAALDLRDDVAKEVVTAQQAVLAVTREVWDGKERRTRPWDGVDRRTGEADRRHPDVLEAPAGAGA